MTICKLVKSKTFPSPFLSFILSFKINTTAEKRNFERGAQKKNTEENLAERKRKYQNRKRKAKEGITVLIWNDRKYKRNGIECEPNAS